MLDYFKRLARPALNGTLDRVGWSQAGADWFRIYFTIAVIMTSGILGLVATSLDRVFLGTVMITFSVMAVPLLYLWQLFVAAYEADQELRDELDGLKTRAQFADGRAARRLRGLLD
jgi:hypothetical protein